MNAVNIIGFNAPEWNISFFGSLFARCLPVGIYTTNTPEACHFIAEHSDCVVVVAEDHLQVGKYIPMLKKGQLKYIVIYNEKEIKYDTCEGRIMLWKDFMALGKRVEKKTILDRMSKIKPGNCCTLVYTSGTTGMPKAVMLSHDNYTWTKKSVDLRRVKEKEAHLTQKRLLSYLPLSHVAAQIQDVTGAMMEGGHVYFADPTALNGPSLVKYLQEVKP
jgi:long-chain-fatty-acid--CoA ligase ACSBG